MALHRFLLIITTAIVLLLLIAAWFLPSEADFRTDNPLWNGTEEIKARYPATPLASLSDLPTPPQGATLILIPYLNFTPTELDEINGFVTQGGTLILADDYGCGNQVLECLGFKEQFSGQPLLDPLCKYKNKWLPQIPHINPSPVTADTESLVFNHATCLTNIEDSDILAWSSRFSFLDQNNNQGWDEAEPTGPLPVISHHTLGSGQVILITDPSLFINSMEEIADNDKLRQSIAAITTANLYIDQSHLPVSSLHQTKNLLAHTLDSLTTLPGTLGVVLVALTVTLIPIWRKPTSKPLDKGDDNDRKAGKETGNS